MRICCISDTHGRHYEFPPGSMPESDTLIFAGDAGFESLSDQNRVRGFFHWLGEQPAKNKIAIAGNHDAYCALNPTLVKECATSEGVIYLNEEEVVIDELKFWGSPYSLEFYNWWFQIDRTKEAAMRHWNRIPDDCDVVILHGPPMGILDSITDEGERLGDIWLLNRILEVKPKLCCYGHIHGYRHWPSDQKIETENTIFVNASMCDEQYNLVHRPVVIEL